MLYLGIDQHGKQLTVNMRGEDGNVLLRRQVSTKWPAVHAFFEELRQRSQEHGGFMAIVEVCGFNDWLLKVLAQYAARDIVLVQPEKREQHKTDRRDAHRLSELLWVNRQRLLKKERIQGLRRVQIVSEEERADRRLTSLRHRVGAARTRVINRVKHLLRRHNLQHECPTKGIQTLSARKWLEKLELPELDRLELDQLLAQWRLLNEQQGQLERRLQDRYEAHPQAKILATIPGAKGYTALGLGSRVPGIENFPRPRSLANFWGLTPKCRDSGETKQRLGSISKQGSALARFLLGQLVLHVLRRDAVMREWFKGIKRRRGAKIARVAVMRRLATIIWHMLKKQQPYAIAKVPRSRATRAAPLVQT
jgi:transposase